MPTLIPKPENVAPMILLLRGEKVLLSEHLAELYAVPVKVLNQAVKRNINRFPADFMFELTRDEAEAISRSRSQIVTLKRGQNIKYLPYAFTEQGIAMLSSVLRSPRCAAPLPRDEQCGGVAVRAGFSVGKVDGFSTP